MRRPLSSVYLVMSLLRYGELNSVVQALLPAVRLHVGTCAATRACEGLISGQVYRALEALLGLFPEAQGHGERCVVHLLEHEDFAPLEDDLVVLGAIADENVFGSVVFLAHS